MITNQYKLIFLLAPLVFSFAIATDLYLPIVPHMQSVLSASAANVQLTLSLFVMAFGLGQLFIGPLSDGYGRRKIVLISITIYCLSSSLLIFTTNISFFILLRLVQAVGACGALVTAFAIVKDVEAQIESAKSYSYLNGIIALSPLLGPILGSYLYMWFGWRACFAFLAILGFLSFLLVLFKLPETLAFEKRNKPSLKIFKNYFLILKNTNFSTYAVSSSTGFASFFSFLSCSPYLLMDKLQVTQQQFGYYFGLISLIFFFGNLLASQFCIRSSVMITNVFGGILLLIGGASMAISCYVFGLNMINFLLPMIIIAFGAAFVISSGTIGAMAPFSSAAGTAAATLGCYQFLFASLVATLMMHIKITSSIPLAITVILLSGLVITSQLIRVQINTKATNLIAR